ncbi:hypothetical protein [Paenibacillus hexagrammi]|uniref:HEAT repeat domain-containing protein n=1 Tax=Paenibacillus hexagrammi TaxID=2908839 RepID=A0ABY3SDM5_9BACL|nr:hypothetical protein [Paenibacillus sp. YPD9-1]UJF32036.1 hypothetical protein L0M14_20160 [Paenibacillus sp. YPD9-1]
MILFPKTEQFYEEELTKCLQKEQYGEAVSMLTFLLQFPSADQQKTEQWQALLNWLQTMQPETVFPALSSQVDEEEEEEDLLRQMVEEKSTVDAAFVEKLLGMLRAGSMDQQLAALEQLAFVQRGPVAEIRSWLRQGPRHPHLQFKALQALKHMGETGSIDFVKNGNHIVVDIEETPLSSEEFPGQIRDMIRRVEEISEMRQPDFAFFAKQTWQEFLSYAYGTPIYVELLTQEDGVIDIWASALHTALQEQLFGTANREELQDIYGIVDSMEGSWNNAYKVLRRHLDTILLGGR